jgi:hypothetical protein
VKIKFKSKYKRVFERLRNNNWKSNSMDILVSREEKENYIFVLWSVELIYLELIL